MPDPHRAGHAAGASCRGRSSRPVGFEDCSGGFRLDVPMGEAALVLVGHDSPALVGAEVPHRTAVGRPGGIDIAG